MHLGAVIGFMAKSAPGWLVPGLALLVLLAWERRWAELRRPELYAGLLLQALIIAPWLWAVAYSTGGAEALRTLFWNNIVGRFTQVAAPQALDYTSGHHNSVGKYFLELPLYLLPWTFVAAASLVRAWRHLGAAGAAGTPWRFALAASLPFLLLLSLAATARDIYAAPALLGFALLAALWLQEAQRAPTRLDQWCVRGTRLLAAIVGGLLVAALLVLALAGSAARAWTVAVSALILALGIPALRRSHRVQARGALGESLTWTYAAYAAALSLSALVAFPVIDRWQDLGSLARRIRADTAHRPLALLDPDETTLAIIDHGFSGSYSVLTGTDVSATRRWFATRGSSARILVLLPGHAEGELTRWLARWYRARSPGDGVAGTLVASGTAALVQRYELPQGRRYALLGPPHPPPP
jgi:4-amino-4-deoxy-L-arabinose transferase-like glycosyltransferase